MKNKTQEQRKSKISVARRNQRFLVSWKPKVSMNLKTKFSNNHRFSRKSQVQMLETIAVLAVFLILIMVVYVFYFGMFKQGIKVEEGELEQLNAIKVAQRASSIPELQCSKNSIAIENCIDLLKLQSISSIINGNKEYYFDKLSFSRISVNEIYPEVKSLSVIYNNPLEDYSSKIVTNIPITLFDPIVNKNKFGVMIVETYFK